MLYIIYYLYVIFNKLSRKIIYFCNLHMFHCFFDFEQFLSTYGHCSCGWFRILFNLFVTINIFMLLIFTFLFILAEIFCIFFTFNLDILFIFIYIILTFPTCWIVQNSKWTHVKRKAKRKDILTKVTLKILADNLKLKRYFLIQQISQIRTINYKNCQICA